MTNVCSKRNLRHFKCALLIDKNRLNMLSSYQLIFNPCFEKVSVYGSALVEQTIPLVTCRVSVVKRHPAQKHISQWEFWIISFL